jgi:hypothetical protein
MLCTQLVYLLSVEQLVPIRADIFACTLKLNFVH